MSADFSKPLHTQSSDAIVDQLRQNIEQVTKLDYTGASNVPVGAVAYDNGLFKRKQNDGTWATLPVTLSASGNLQLDLLSAKAISVANSALGSSTVQINTTGIVADGAIESKDELIAPNIQTLRDDVDELMQTTSVFETGTLGNDFNIDQSTPGVTKFNIPDAAGNARGLIATTSQTLAGEKTFTSLLVVNPGRIQLGRNATATNNWHITSEGANGKLLILNGNYDAPIGTQLSKVVLTSSAELGLGTDSPEASVHVTGRNNSSIMLSGVDTDNSSNRSGELVLSTFAFSGASVGKLSLKLDGTLATLKNDIGELNISTEQSLLLKTGSSEQTRIKVFNTGETTFASSSSTPTSTVQVETGVASGASPTSEKGRASHNTILRLTKDSAVTTNNTLLFQTSGSNHLVTFARQGSTAGTLAVGTESTDDLILHTNKLSRVIVNGTSGNVGVALSSPQEIAHIKGKVIVGDEDTIPTLSSGVSPTTTADRGRLSIITNGQNPDILLFNKAAAASGNSARIGINRALTDSPLVVASNSSIHFRTESSSVATVGLSSGTTKLFLSNSGSVGIGTTSPAEKLHVNGVLRLDSAPAPNWDTGTRLWVEGGFGSRYDGYAHRFDVGNTRTEALRITNGGYVGIGTATPSEKFQVEDGNIKITGGHLYLNTGWSVQHNGGTGNQWRTGPFYAEDSYSIVHSLNNFAAYTGVMTLKSSGNVGIGTISPTSKLHVDGTISSGPITAACTSNTWNSTLGSTAGAGLNVRSPQGNYGIVFGVSDDGDGWIQAQRSEAPASAFNLNLQVQGGNVGIGTITPTSKLHVVGGNVTADGFTSGTTGMYSTGQVAIQNVSPTIYFADTNNRSAAIHVNSDLFYLLSGPANMTGTTWDGYPLIVNLNSGLMQTAAIDTRNNNISAGSGTIWSGAISSGSLALNSSTTNTIISHITASSASFGTTVQMLQVPNIDVAHDTAPFYFLQCYDNGGATYGGSGAAKAYIRADGLIAGDRDYKLGADYAECFEWLDGNTKSEDRRCVSVSLHDGKIKIAEPGEEPIGVISTHPSVVGDTAWGHWNEKYLKDEYGSVITEEYKLVSWKNSSGEEVAYATDRIPAGQIVPQSAIVTTKTRNKLNPKYSPTREYVPRSERKEWAAVGLVGKLRVRKGQVIGSRWIKLRDISDNVEEYLVR